MAEQAPPHAGRPARALEFAAPAGLGSFLLTCLEEPSFAHGSVTYETYLNTIYVRRAPPHTVHVRVVADPAMLELLLQMAVASGGTGRPLEEMNETYAKTDINGFLMRIRLQPASRGLADSDRFLLAHAT